MRTGSIFEARAAGIHAASALDMEGELFVELLLDAVWPEQRARPELQVAEGHASFITRPMAFAIRSRF